MRLDSVYEERAKLRQRYKVMKQKKLQPKTVASYVLQFDKIQRSQLRPAEQLQAFALELVAENRKKEEQVQQYFVGLFGAVQQQLNAPEFFRTMGFSCAVDQKCARNYMLTCANANTEQKIVRYVAARIDKSKLKFKKGKRTAACKGFFAGDAEGKWGVDELLLAAVVLLVTWNQYPQKQQQPNALFPSLEQM